MVNNDMNEVYIADFLSFIESDLGYSDNTINSYDTELSDWADDGNLIAGVSGLVTGGSFTFSDNSDMFASGSLTFIVDEIWSNK